MLVQLLMLKFTFTIVTFLFCIVCFSQTDIVIIKKNGRSIKTFFAGSFATFQTTSGEWFNSNITAIRDDTLFFREVVVRQVMTQFGVSRLDTMTTYTRKIHYKEIAGIPKVKEGLHVRPESLMMIGGAGYAALNIINSAYLHYAPFGKDNRPKLLPAVGVFATGYILSKFRKNYLAIGKKYTVQYVKLRKP